jgi:phosphate/sulfate permease
VIHSVIEIVGVALEGNEILGDLFDVVVDQSFVQEQISSVVRMMNL